jgi:dihydropteroate synthase
VPYALPEGRIAVMGVLNVTPDSFSDGGLFFDQAKAVEHALHMVDEGADLIDVGGESTRPGAEPVSPEEELRRVLPVVTELARRGVSVSIDTSKPEVAMRCLQAGATVVNDVTGLRDPAMVEVCAEAGCTVCVMHMQGEPRTMQSNPTYDDVVNDVKRELAEAARSAIEHGVAKENVWLDPGIGFGKTVAHNLELINRLDEIVALDYPVLIGVSRKSFIGRLLGSEGQPASAEQRLEGSLAAQVIAQTKGARVVRTHDVAATVRAAKLAQAILSQG